MPVGGIRIGLCILAAAVMTSPAPGHAFDRVEFEVAPAEPGLREKLENASLLRSSQTEGAADPRDLLAAARADYARLLDTLYAAGYYGGVIHILVDGREAAGIPAFAAPERIGRVVVRIDPGAQFRFSTAVVAPLPPGAVSPAEFRAGAAARSTVIRDAVETAVSDWRDAGHAKADISDQRIVADHRDNTLDARIALIPGPLVRFGELVQLTPSAVRAERIARIAGLPVGEVFSPAALRRVAERLRRTGAFSSVSLSEAEALGPGNRMDVALELDDEKPRRYGFGAEVTSLEGLTVSGFWLHRNLFGGAERLRIEGEVSDIRGTLAGMDYALSARLDIPAAFGTDIDAFVTAEAEYRDDPAFLAIQGGAGAGVHRRFSDRVDGEIGVSYRYAFTDDSLGERRFSLLSLPGKATWDGRNDALDPSAGYYVDAELEPFHDFAGGATGVRGWLDGRVYWGVGADDRFVLAGRAQVGAVAGAGASDVPPDFLFFSGGGGTVRGFPYQSLGVDTGGGIIGGRAFLGLSGELRYRVSDAFGLVGFADIGHVGADRFFDGGGGWQAGAGVGLRYYTGLGPVRLDVAMPVYGTGGSGAQLYLGIGQSF